MLTTKKRSPPKPSREERCAALVASTLRPTSRVVMATAQSLAGRPVKAEPAKLPRKARTVQAIRNAARDEDCTVRIAGACNSNPATSVWSHFPGLDGDRGMGIKALDLCGAIACSACHDVVDGRAPMPAGATRSSVMLDWFHGHMRSLVVLARKGVL